MLPAATVAAINESVNSAFHWCAEVPCTAAGDYRPAMAGDCKQVAAEKLRRLIMAGAKPGDFTIWVTKVGGRVHAVLVENATGLVLNAWSYSVRVTRGDGSWLTLPVGSIRSRAADEADGMVFVAPHPEWSWYATMAAWAQTHGTKVIAATAQAD
jgi:hypothetical protein